MSSLFFPYVGAFFWVGVLLSFAAFLRSRVTFFQKNLIPSALIGGVIGFVLMNFGLIGMPTQEGWKEIPTSAFGVLVSHLFVFGFIGIGLIQQDEPEADKANSSWIRSGALWLALIYCLIYAIQGITGRTVFELYSYLTSGEIFTGYGYLVSVGFSQNPGAAQAIGGIWENEYGVQKASTVGLAFGAAGFLFAVLIGIPFANQAIKKGWLSEKHLSSMPKPLLTGIMGKGNSEPCAQSTTHSANIDTFAFHFAVMFVLYGAGYVFALAWATFSWPESIEKVRGLGFGMLYVWGMLAGVITRKTLRKIKSCHVLDNSTTRRITGTTVDFMICAVFLAIGINDIQQIIVPFLTTTICASVISFFVIVWFARRMPKYGFERGLAAFGCYTGTVASGLLLLRIVDPEFKSPAAFELAIMNIFILPIVQIIYINLPFVPSSNSIMLPVLTVYVVTMIASLFLLGFVKKRAW